MAEHLVSIYGTEKDKVNCPFYYKIGACRHGDRCSRVHNKPLFSQTILLENLYISPDQIIASAAAQGLPTPKIPPEDIANHFDDFYYDVYEEMRSYGKIDALYVCENLADHLAGNTYVKFRDEASAQAALLAVNGRYYAARPVKAEFSPVTDFREGKCRPFERDGFCERGDYCHFMHLRRQPLLPSSPQSQELEHKRGERERQRQRERDREHDRTRERDQYRERSRGRDRERYLSPPRERHSHPRDYSDRSFRDHDRYWDRDSKHSYVPEKRRDGGRYSDRDRRHSYERDNPPSEYKDRPRDRYGDYDRSYRSSRDRRGS